MGCYNGTCGLTQLPIMHYDRIAMIIMVRHGNFDKYGFCYPYEIYKPYTIPIYGKYNDYGSIEEVDASAELVFEHFKEQIAKEDITCTHGIPENIDELITGIIRGDIYATPLGPEKDKYFFDVIMFHEEAYNQVIENLGNRKPYTKDFTLREDFEARFDQTAANIDRWRKSDDPIDQFRLNSREEALLRYLGLYSDFTDFIYKYLDTGNPDVKKGVVELLIMNVALSLSRKAWLPQSGGGSQAQEVMIHKILAEFMLKKVQGIIDESEDHDETCLEETLFSFKSPLDKE